MDAKEEIQISHQLWKVISVDLILRELGKYLRFEDLMSCTLVSKLWCEKFRGYVYGERTCNITLEKRKTPCVKLNQLNNLLMHSSGLLPFNGFSFCDEPYKGSLCSRDHSNTVEVTFSSILEKVHFASLVINYDRLFMESTCPAVGFVKHLLKYHGAELKRIVVRSLSFESIWSHLNIPKEKQSNFFANLRTLHIEAEGFCNAYIEEIVAASPAIKVIGGVIPPVMFDDRKWSDSPCYNGKIPKSKYHLVTECVSFPPTSLLNLAKETPRLEALKLVDSRGYVPRETMCKDTLAFPIWDLPYDWMATFTGVKMLLSASWISLREIQCSIAQFVPIHHYLHASTLRLRHLSMLDLYGARLPEPEYEVFFYLKFFDFGNLFPKLTTLKLHPSDFESRNGFTMDSSLISTELGFTREVLTVDTFHLYTYPFPEELMHDIVRKFPNVETFTFHDCWTLPLMCPTIWKTSWTYLKELRFCSVPADWDVENIIFGLDQEEMEYIKSEHLDVQSLHATFRRHSVFNLEYLRVLRMRMGRCYNCRTSEDRSKMLSLPVLSTFAVEMIHRHLPNLRIECIAEEAYIPPGKLCDSEYAIVQQRPGPGAQVCCCDCSHNYHSNGSGRISEELMFVITFK